MTRVALAAAAMVLIAATARADEWVDAHRSGDAARLAHLASSAALQDLKQRIRSNTRGVRLAALTAAPSLSDGWVVLDALAAAAATPDRATAIAAARAAQRISAPIDLATARQHDIAPDQLERAASSWLARANDPAAFPDVRVLALEVATQLHRAVTPQRSEAAIAAFKDDEPELRRAAVELLTGDVVDANATAIAALTKDPEAFVALAAAATLCGGLAHRRPAKPRLEALGADGLTRLQQLVRDPTLSAGALLDAARCLAADGSPKSRAALTHLRKRGPRSIRRRVSRFRVR